jgi:hypothetical protein
MSFPRSCQGLRLRRRDFDIGRTPDGTGSLNETRFGQIYSDPRADDPSCRDRVGPAANNRAKWQSLNDAAVHAYGIGAVGDAISFVQNELGLARSAFGRNDPDTLSSMNNLGFHAGATGSVQRGRATISRDARLAPQGVGPRTSQHSDQYE